MQNVFSRKVETTSNLPLLSAMAPTMGYGLRRNISGYRTKTLIDYPTVSIVDLFKIYSAAQNRSRDPQQSLKSIQVPEGFRVELVAAEPLVMDPIAIDWGPMGSSGGEMADYPLALMIRNRR